MDSRQFIQASNDRKLPAGYAGDVLVWDIDKTYLDTRFSSFRGLLAIPFELAIDKRAVGGAPALLRALRTGPDEHAPRLTPLYFVSGSPPSLRTVIERKMTLDGVQFDGITFKDQLRLLLHGRPRAIAEQVGYKLCALLLLRQELPKSVRFVLFGDDVERDVEAFLLFGDVLAGLRGPQLRERLRAVGVGWPEVETALRLAAGIAVENDPVEKIFVHSQHGRFLTSTPDARVIATRSFLQTALVLFDMGRIHDAGVRAVVAELRALRVPDEALLELVDDARRRLGVSARAAQPVINVS